MQAALNKDPELPEVPSALDLVKNGNNLMGGRKWRRVTGSRA